MKWIKCNDKLPDQNEEVICFGIHEGDYEFSVESGYMWVCRGTPLWSTYKWDGCSGEEWFTKVTHWMPLPEPPDELE